MKKSLLILLSLCLLVAMFAGCTAATTAAPTTAAPTTAAPTTAAPTTAAPTTAAPTTAAPAGDFAPFDTTGWKTSDITFVDPMLGELTGKMFWDPASMRWEVTYDTKYGPGDLNGTYTADGTLTLQFDLSDGYGGSTATAVQEAFKPILLG